MRRKYLLFLWVFSILAVGLRGDAQAQFDRPEHGGEFLEEMGDKPKSEPVTKAPYFTEGDLYFVDKEGQRSGLNLSLRECALKLKEGAKMEEVESAIRTDGRVYSLEKLEHLGMFLIVLEYRFRKEGEMLKLINDFNKLLDEQALVLPIFVIGKKKEVLSNEFSVKFKSFVSKNDINSMNIKNKVGFVDEQADPETGDTYRLKQESMLERNVLQMIHLYHEDPLVKYAEPIFISIKKPIAVIAQMEATTTEVGDTARYLLHVFHDEDINVDWSFLTKDSINLTPQNILAGLFKIVGEEPREALEVDGQILESRAYNIVLYNVGEFEIPAVGVYYTKVGMEERVLEEKSNPVTVKVASLVPAGMKDINGVVNDISYAELVKGYSLPRPQLAIGLSLVAASVVLFLIHRSRRSSAGAAESEAGPSQVEEALDRLNRLIGVAGGGSLLANPEELERFYDDVNHAYRRALRAACGFEAEAGSVTRVLNEMERLGIDGGLRTATERVLSEFCNRRFLPRAELAAVPPEQFRDAIEELKAAARIFEAPGGDGPI